HLHLLMDLRAETAVVELSIGLLEKRGEEFFGEAFLEHVDAEVASVERDEGMRAARGRHARGAGHFTGDEFVESGAVLHAVVELKPLEAVEAIGAFELRAVDGDSRARIDWLEAAGRALELDGHVLVILPALFLEGCLNVGTRLFAQFFEALRVDLDVDGG